MELLKIPFDYSIDYLARSIRPSAQGERPPFGRALIQDKRFRSQRFTVKQSTKPAQVQTALSAGQAAWPEEASSRGGFQDLPHQSEKLGAFEGLHDAGCGTRHLDGFNAQAGHDRPQAA